MTGVGAVGVTLSSAWGLKISSRRSALLSSAAMGRGRVRPDGVALLLSSAAVSGTATALQSVLHRGGR